MHEIMKKYKELKEKHPTIDHDLVMLFAEEMPEEFEKILCICEHGRHIASKEMYEKAVACFENPDGTKGAHWSIDAVEKNVSIDFEQKEYTLLDFAYSVNMKFSDVGDLVNTETIFKMAKRYLEDPDYYGDPSERSYYDAKERTEYFEEG